MKLEQYLGLDRLSPNARPMSQYKRGNSSYSKYGSLPTNSLKGRTRIQSSRMVRDGIPEVDEAMERSTRNFNKDARDGHFSTPQKLPQISRNNNKSQSRDALVGRKLAMQGIRASGPRTNSSELYNELSNQLKNKKMLNNSNNMAACLSGNDYAGSQARLPGKLEQSMHVQEQLSRISHIIDDFR